MKADQGKPEFDREVLDFYADLNPGFRLPPGIELLNPFCEPETIKSMDSFYRKFYHDSNPRFFIYGINPGRFGAGVTGIPFTDPIRLETDCGIKNSFRKVPELSSVFIYKMIDAYGSVEKFYRNFFITAVCPLGFVKNNRNLNYYDQPDLLAQTRNFLIESIRKQLSWPVRTEACICLGEGKNFKQFSLLNAEFKFFRRIIPLSHPRFIMQYKRREMDRYIDRYLETFEQMKM